MSMNKNPGLWIIILLAVTGWNLYEIFGPQSETPPQSIVILSGVLVVCGLAGLAGAIIQRVQQKSRTSA
ncbi:MAG TPA: hypothetical protein VG308_19180 [Stellaceae bacterium]|jgi:hypothetical protein|nr:hypothetical protein [Stellaceae bacterium]